MDNIQGIDLVVEYGLRKIDVYVIGFSVYTTLDFPFIRHWIFRFEMAARRALKNSKRATATLDRDEFDDAAPSSRNPAPSGRRVQKRATATADRDESDHDDAAPTPGNPTPSGHRPKKTTAAHSIADRDTSETRGGADRRDARISFVDSGEPAAAPTDGATLSNVQPPLSAAMAATPSSVSFNAAQLECLLKSLSCSQQNSGAAGSSLRMESFDGLPSTDAAAWISKFKSYIYLNGWNSNSEKVVHIMRLLFQGSALPFLDKLPLADTLSVEAIFTAFEINFISPQSHWLIEQQLWSRNLAPDESLDSYMASIDQMCGKLKKCDSDIISCFVRGLPSYLRYPVISSEPRTLLSAYQTARLAMAHLAPPSNTNRVAIAAVSEPRDWSADMKRSRDENPITTAAATPHLEAPLSCQLCGRYNHAANACGNFQITPSNRGYRGGRGRGNRPGVDSSYPRPNDRRCWNCGDKSHMAYDQKCPLNSNHPSGRGAMDGF